MIRIVRKSKSNRLKPVFEMVHFKSLQSSYLRPYRLVPRFTVLRCKVELENYSVGECFLLKSNCSSWSVGLTAAQMDNLGRRNSRDEREGESAGERRHRRNLRYYVSGYPPYQFSSARFRQVIPEEQWITGAMNLSNGSQDQLEYLGVTDIELWLPVGYKESCKK